MIIIKIINDNDNNNEENDNLKMKIIEILNNNLK